MRDNREGVVAERSTVDIFLLKYKSPVTESRCIDSILHHTEWPYHLHVVDWREGGKNIAGAWNYLIRQHGHYYYKMFLDSDTVVSPQWLTRMMDVMQARKDAGVVVPITNHCGENRQLGVDPASDIVTLPLASGFCFLFHMSAYLDCGKFNSEFRFYGQDSEWLIRMVAKTKWKIYLQPRTFVHHEGSYSVRKVENQNYDFDKDKRDALILFWKYAKEYGSKL